ncbi:hypothetical protein UFOVP1616_60 [uncultured Caudovirales phage]|uniref:CHAP domain containing protein n=1 Tax=uncultured Caudovirales phage TaxID=2100421 RepID=A0A6J5SK35_9CAUD|nr:hypothetical protein UFOVP1467_13 [uncultured Caudovirales phage]CAB4219679.1 hypothetical protein UFOVP1616_60 [uncultured Caudovirales phage]
MGKRAKFVELLLAQEGVIEGPNNETIYGAATGYQHQPWCGSLRVWAAKQVKYRIVNCVSTVAGAAAYKKNGKWHDVATTDPATVQEGWAVFMGFDPKNPKAIQHVGTWIRYNGDGTAAILEGNTSPDKKGSQANGGQVALKVRAVSKKNGSKMRRSMPVFIIGYGQEDETGAPA